jgi:hypothetical protein
VSLALLRGALPFLGPFFFGEARPLDVVAALTSANFAKPEGSKEWAAFAQALAVAMWLAHFVKRELESCVCGGRTQCGPPAAPHFPPPHTYPHPFPHPRSAFVHKFSHPTMPLSQLFKNSTYYWGFACAVAFPLVHPLYQAPGKTQVAFGFALWVACQLVNLAVHLQLAGMRGSDLDDSRKPPRGPLFSLVTSPNYTSEVLGWVAWSIASNIFMGYVFTLVGFAQMAQWALQKYRGCKFPSHCAPEGGGKRANTTDVNPFLDQTDLKDEPEGKAYAKARKSIVPFLF